METLKSYVYGTWVAASGKVATLHNPTTEEPIAQAGTEGIDFGHALSHARDIGGPALRALSFAQRGEILRAMSKAIYAAREELIEIGIKNAGNTRGDAKFDVDGASGTLMAYADIGKELGDARFFVDGDAISMGRSSRMSGQHVLFPREGAAVHVNAFNFPAWGLAEKAACAILAGVPVITKPATATAWMTERMVQRMVETNAIPAGVLSLVTGSTGNLLQLLGPQDSFAFTGSSSTGTSLKALSNIVTSATRVNIEADSLNAAVLGPDVERGSETYDLFVADVVRDATQKAGQKCTAIRRVFVPQAIFESVRDDLADRLSSAKIGDPTIDGMQVGPLATADQLRDVRAGIQKLVASERLKVVTGGVERPKSLAGITNDKGYFVAPTLLAGDDARGAKLVHEHEVFGPSVTLLPYSGQPEEAAALVRLGHGGLVASVYSDDRAFAREIVFGIGAWNGRIFIGSAKVAGVSLGPGTVLPQLVHGGPGRAGGGEELGGIRGLLPYLQRVALQGYGPMIDAIAAPGKRLGNTA
jgi:3,4-dehydroadipyl-CoA semialdehyde dehydrogenase